MTFNKRKEDTFLLSEVFTIQEEDAIKYLKGLFWPVGATCPYCNGQNCTQLRGPKSKAHQYQCRTCRRIFSFQMCTPFKGSHLPMAKWLAAIYLWFQFEDKLYPQYLKEALKLLSHKTAKSMLKWVRENMGEQKFREQFVALRGPRPPQPPKGWDKRYLRCKKKFEISRKWDRSSHY